MMNALLSLAATGLSLAVLQAVSMVTPIIKTNRKSLIGVIVGVLSLCDLPHATSAAWQRPPFQFGGGTSNEWSSTSAADDNGHIMRVQQQFGGSGNLVLYYYTDGAWTLSQTLLTPPGIATGYSSMVAMEPSGTGLVGYYDSTSGDLTARYFDGSTWSTPTPTPLDNYLSGYGVLVALNGPGSGLMVWGSSSNQIKGSFLSGGTWSTPVVIDSPGSLFAYPDIAYSANGSAIVFSTLGQASINSYNGTSWQPKQLSSDPYYNLGGIDDSGNAVLYGSDGNNIFVGFFNAVTSVLSAPQTISTGTGNDSPKIIMAPNGTAVAVWKTGALTAVFSLYDGSDWSAPQTLPFEVASSDNGLGMDSAGNTILVWSDSANQLLASRLPLGGTDWGPEEIVAPSGTIAADIFAGLSLNGTGFSTWLSINNNAFGNASIIPNTTEIYDCSRFKSATGELLVAEDDLIAPLKFAYNTNTYSAITETTGDGTVTYDFGLALLESLDTGTAKIASGIRAFADPGQGVSCVFAASFYEIGEGSSSIAGLGNDTDGFFFSLDEATFGIVHRNNSVDTFIPQNEWNVDTMDGNGPSGEVLNHTLGNVYKIQYMRLEFGNINFYIESQATGRFVLVNQIQYTNNNTVPSLTNPGLQLMAQVISTSTGVYMELSSMGLYTEGYANPQLGIRNNVSSFNTLNTDLLCSLSIRNDSVFSSITNQTMVFPDQMSLLNASSSGDNIIVSLYLNPNFDSPITFNQVNSNSCVSYSVETTIITGGTFIGSFGLSSGSTKAIRLQDYGIELSPGDILVIAGSALLSTAEIRNSVSWLEQF